MAGQSIATLEPSRADGALDALIERLNGQHRRLGDRLRVWSVAMTIFGDAVVPRGGVLRMGALSQITGRMGIENNALRTAMSRLAIDGWVERERSGRSSYYRLTQSGLKQTLAASRRIYSPSGATWVGEWQAAVAAGDAPLSPDERARLAALGFHRTGDGLHVRPWSERAEQPDADLPVELFRMRSHSWTGDRLLATPGGGLDQLYEDVWRLFSPFADVVDGRRLDPLDAITARTLLIHVWRRIVLKDVHVPDEMRLADWPGHDARQLVALLYRELLPASEAWLDRCEGAPGGRLPAPSDELAARFTHRNDR